MLIYKIGSPENPATEKDIKDFSDLLIEAYKQGAKAIVTHHAVHVEYIPNSEAGNHDVIIPMTSATEPERGCTIREIRDGDSIKASDFSPIQIRDDDQKKQIIMQLYDKGLISRTTLCEKLDIDFDLEVERMRYEDAMSDTKKVSEGWPTPICETKVEYKNSDCNIIGEINTPYKVEKFPIPVKESCWQSEIKMPFIAKKDSEESPGV